MPLEQNGLASFACHPPSQSSRLYPIEEEPGRSPFQRDCDRIVHTKAFRRLMHKTQVFVAPDGDHVRTRLTHTIEVSRVARSIANALSLDPDLADAVALAHDLGHPPFGHAGEEALSELMEEYGGFEHNAQAIRIVTSLERQYIEHDGLNLTWETLEGIAKHNGPIVGDVPFALSEYNRCHDLALSQRASAEAQVAAAADDVAYICHDLQDGLRAGMFSLDEICPLPVVGPVLDGLESAHPRADTERVAQTMLRRIFKILVNDIILSTQQRLLELAPESAEDVRQHDRNVVGPSEETRAMLDEIRNFLRVRMYRSGDVELERQHGQEVVCDLFCHLMEETDLLPPDWRLQANRAGNTSDKARVLADFIAGMTDNFALAMHSMIDGGSGQAIGSGRGELLLSRRAGTYEP